MNLNKQTITYIFIIIFIIITFIHLYKINNKHNKNDKENFADLKESQNLQGFDVYMNSMNQVNFTENNKNLKIIIEEIINDKASKTELDSLNNKVEEKASKTELNDVMPELSIISYAGSNPPTGWQLCDGENLEKSNVSSTAPINEKFAYDSNGDPIKTPDLRGRFILGSGQGQGNQLTNRVIHNIGGEENHTLTVNEIPNHLHYTYADDAGGVDNIWGSASRGKSNAQGGEFTGEGTVPGKQDGYNTGHILDTAGNWVSPKEMPHNNMPPYYVLTYIIKQPSPPTSS